MINYILNNTQSIMIVNKNCIYVKSYFTTYSLKGENIDDLITDITSLFKEPNSLENVLTILLDKYSKEALSTILNLFVERQIIIPVENYSEDSNVNILNSINDFKLTSSKIDEIKNNTSIGLISDKEFISELKNIQENFKIRNFNFLDLTSSLYNIKEKIEYIINNSTVIILLLKNENQYLINIVNEICILNNKPYLVGIIDGYTSEIGPFIIPKKSPCYKCYQFRMKNNIENTIVLNNINNDSQTENLFYPIVKIVCGIVINETFKYLYTSNSILIGNILTTNYLTYNQSIHKVIKAYNCPICS